MRERFVLALLLLTAAGRTALAADQWVEIASPHFTLSTDAGEKDGRKTLDQLERMRWVFQTLYPNANVDPPAPIVVIATKNEKTFDSLEPAAYLAKGALKLGGYFLRAPDKNYILLNLAASSDHPFAAVYHEYTHLEFSSAAEWMPLWLNEGTAEFMQNTDIRGKEVLLGQPSADDILYLRQQALIPLKVLLAVDQNSPYYHQEQKGSVFYSESWALTHYLIVTDRLKHTTRYEDYLALVRKHEDPVAAGEKAFGDLKKMENELNAYIQQGMYQQFVMNSAAAPIDETTYKVRALSPTDADARRADVQACVRRTDEARALANAVMQADPNNAQARETMGLLASLDHDP